MCIRDRVSRAVGAYSLIREITGGTSGNTSIAIPAACFHTSICRQNVARERSRPGLFPVRAASVAVRADRLIITEALCLIRWDSLHRHRRRVVPADSIPDLHTRTSYPGASRPPVLLWSGSPACLSNSACRVRPPDLLNDDNARKREKNIQTIDTVSYTHLRAHETM